MTRHKLALLITTCLFSGFIFSTASYGASAFGFGVGAPASYPIDWTTSFPFITAEAFTDSNLSILGTLGTYPADFPTGFETSVSLLAKGWSGPISVYAGGGISVYWDWIAASSAWNWSPYMNMIAGIQWRVVEPLSIALQLRSLDPIPLTFTLHPQVSLGASLVLGSPSPRRPKVDRMTMWIIVGLGVLALVAYLPRV